MGHSVTGLISKAKELLTFAQKRSLHKPIALSQGFAILPLRGEDIDSFLAPSMSGHPKGFVYLSKQFIEELSSASKEGEILYFETEYFGGTGTQGAAVFSRGNLIFGPKSEEIGPINDALRILGVEVGCMRDEFEAIGLNRYRHTEDWLEVVK